MWLLVFIKVAMIEGRGHSNMNKRKVQQGTRQVHIPPFFTTNHIVIL